MGRLEALLEQAVRVENSQRSLFLHGKLAKLKTVFNKLETMLEATS
jgi:hypothetical protein